MNAKKLTRDRLATMPPAVKQELDGIEARAILEFQGVLADLEAALGMLRLGHHFGWKVLYVCHSKRTIRKYEDILGIKIREVFPELGPSAQRSWGYKLVSGVSNFWKAISGETPIPDRQKIT